MKAIILAAGYGNRMGLLTRDVHKTLLKIGDKTIIERIIDGLCENGIADIVVVTGYREAELKSYLLKHYPKANFKFVHNARYRETNNIYSMALAFDSITIDDDILLIESDLIYEPSVIKRLLDSRQENVALLDKYRSGMDGTVVRVMDGVIAEVIPPHLQHGNFDFSDKYKTLNIYKFSRKFCNEEFKRLLTYYAKVIDDNCYYELILGILIYMKRETIHAEILEGEKWAEVDDPNDLRVAEFIFNKGKRSDILENSFGGYWAHQLTDFCFIRNMYFPNDSIISEMRNNLPSLMHNYGSRQSVLNEKLAYFLLCNKDRVHVLNGASQIYPILREYFAGRKALLPAPTFGEYPRNFPVHEIYSDAVGIDPGEVEKKAARSDLIIFVNPNNPTGSEMPTEWLYNFAGENPDKMIVIDESFIEFSASQSVINLLEDKPLDNIIVIKSLSKSLGIPGLRLGYVYSANQVLNRHIADRLPIWNLNSFAEFFLEIILKHRNSFNQSINATKRDRQEFANALENISLIEKVYPSGGNYLLVKVNRKCGTGIAEKLLSERSLYIKDISNKFNDGGIYCRLAVRLPAENLSLVAGLKALSGM